MGIPRLLFHPDGDPDHSQNVIVSQLAQDSSSDNFRKIEQQYLCNLADIQTDKGENRQS